MLDTQEIGRILMPLEKIPQEAFTMNVHKFEAGRQYKHIPSNKIYTYLYSNPPDQVTMWNELSIDKKEERFPFPSSEFRELTVVEDVDFEVLKNVISMVEAEQEIVDGAVVDMKKILVGEEFRTLAKEVGIDIDDFVVTGMSKEDMFVELIAKLRTDHLKYKEIAELSKELITLITKIETNDDGKEFYPTTIRSCRCMDSDRIGKIIPELEKLLK